jgi:catechol-2,3-dioxygenase
MIRVQQQAKEQVMQIDEVVLDTADPAAMQAFYMRVLQRSSDSGAERAMVCAGRTRLIFQGAHPEERPHYHIAFAVPLERFDIARQQVATHTSLIAVDGSEIIVHRGWDAVACYFRDPAGNILECIARRSEQTDSAEAVNTPVFIQSVCEVGLVVDDVRATTQLLRDALGIALFHGSEGELFTALGTETGLLIVVSRGREWYPSTGVATEPAPLQLTLTGNDGARHQRYPMRIIM